MCILIAYILNEPHVFFLWESSEVKMFILFGSKNVKVSAIIWCKKKNAVPGVKRVKSPLCTSMIT